jgi:hypothetical protein
MVESVLSKKIITRMEEREDNAMRNFYNICVSPKRFVLFHWSLRQQRLLQGKIYSGTVMGSGSV